MVGGHPRNWIQIETGWRQEPHCTIAHLCLLKLCINTSKQKRDLWDKNNKCYKQCFWLHNKTNYQILPFKGWKVLSVQGCMIQQGIWATEQDSKWLLRTNEWLHVTAASGHILDLFHKLKLYYLWLKVPTGYQRFKPIRTINGDVKEPSFLIAEQMT